MRVHRLIGAAALIATTACSESEPFGIESIELIDADPVELAQDELATEVVLAEGAALLRDGGSAPLFERLAGAIPGFGGLYRTARCEVALVLTEGADVAAAVRIVHAALVPLVQRTCADGITVQPVRGQFTYNELRRYLLASRPLHEIDGVLGAFIHIRRNRLAFVVVDRRTAAAVVNALPRVGIPLEGVVFVRGSLARVAS